MSELPTEMSEFSVALAPAPNTATVHTSAPVALSYTTTFSGSQLSTIATRLPGMIVGVVPDPGLFWPDLTRFVLPYGGVFQVSVGIPPTEVNRYIAWVLTMYTPPLSSMANELPMPS